MKFAILAEIAPQIYMWLEPYEAQKVAFSSRHHIDHLYYYYYHHPLLLSIVLFTFLCLLYIVNFYLVFSIYIIYIL